MSTPDQLYDLHLLHPGPANRTVIASLSLIQHRFNERPQDFQTIPNVTLAQAVTFALLNNVPQYVTLSLAGHPNLIKTIWWINRDHPELTKPRYPADQLHSVFPLPPHTESIGTVEMLKRRWIPGRSFNLIPDLPLLANDFHTLTSRTYYAHRYAYYYYELEELVANHPATLPSPEPSLQQVLGFLSQTGLSDAAAPNFVLLAQYLLKQEERITQLEEPLTPESKTTQQNKTTKAQEAQEAQ